MGMGMVMGMGRAPRGVFVAPKAAAIDWSTLGLTHPIPMIRGGGMGRGAGTGTGSGTAVGW